jgi:TRAP-type mannitol/chloroaromatic compound transport system permease large subunit
MKRSYVSNHGKHLSTWHTAVSNPLWCSHRLYFNPNTFLYILITDAVPLVLSPSQMFNTIDSVPLTAIAFFMLTGELMTSATITDRLVALSRALIGRLRGGLVQVNVFFSMFFAGWQKENVDE